MRRSHWDTLYAPGTNDVKDTFVDGIYEEQSIGCGAATTVTKYYMAFGRVIASRTVTSSSNV